MTNFLMILFFVLFVALILGLIKPSIVLFWGSKTRKQAFLVYGLSLIIVFIASVFSAGNSNTKQKEDTKSPDNKVVLNETKETIPIKKSPQGSIIYEITCTGSNTQGVDVFKAFSPTIVSLYYSSDTFRMIEKGGSAGDILADFSQGKIFILDPVSKTAKKANCTDMEKEMQDLKMQKMMPTYYRAVLEETADTAAICGLECKKYKVLKSGFIKAYASAEVWITYRIDLKQMRFDFQTESQRFMTPLPLQIGIDSGTILKMTVNENNVIVTYTATSVSGLTPDIQLFELPSFYRIAE
jgi:hypothetical protein